MPRAFRVAVGLCTHHAATPCGADVAADAGSVPSSAAAFHANALERTALVQQLAGSPGTADQVLAAIKAEMVAAKELARGRRTG